MLYPIDRALAPVLAMVLLIIIGSFGAIIALVYRGRGSSFSYLEGAMYEPNEKAEWRSRAMD
jgi:hypothetical protein